LEYIFQARFKEEEDKGWFVVAECSFFSGLFLSGYPDAESA